MSKIDQNRPRIRLVLLGLQILLPFALYLVLNLKDQLLGIIIGVLFGLSMLALVVVG